MPSLEILGIVRVAPHVLERQHRHRVDRCVRLADRIRSARVTPYPSARITSSARRRRERRHQSAGLVPAQQGRPQSRCQSWSRSRSAAGCDRHRRRRSAAGVTSGDIRSAGTGSGALGAEARLSHRCHACNTLQIAPQVGRALVAQVADPCRAPCRSAASSSSGTWSGLTRADRLWAIRFRMASKTTAVESCRRTPAAPVAIS